MSKYLFYESSIYPRLCAAIETKPETRCPSFIAVMGTKELTKCYEPLQKLRVRLGTCKIDLSPPVILQCILLIVPRRCFCGGSFVLNIFVLLAPYVCFHILGN